MINDLEVQLDIRKRKRIKIYLNKYFFKSVKKHKKEIEKTYNVKIKKVR